MDEDELLYDDSDDEEYGNEEDKEECENEIEDQNGKDQPVSCRRPLKPKHNTGRGSAVNDQFGSLNERLTEKLFELYIKSSHRPFEQAKMKGEVPYYIFVVCSGSIGSRDGFVIPAITLRCWPV